MQELRCSNDLTIRVHGKGSRFVLLGNEKYCKKVQHQINIISFTLLNSDPTKKYCMIKSLHGLKNGSVKTKKKKMQTLEMIY